MIRATSAVAKSIYADYQASTPLDKKVAHNIGKYFHEQCANPHAEDHALGWHTAKLLDDARKALAAAIGADEDEVIFTSGATEANNLAILGMAVRATPSRRRILVSAVDHKSILAPARAAIKFGCEIELMPVDAGGELRLNELEHRIDESVLAISAGLVNGEIGTRQPLEKLVALAASVGAFLHTDAAQALADNSLNMHALGVGAASLSAHKIYGPQGVGALFIRRDWQSQVSPRALGGGQQRGLRCGTIPVALCRAFADAVHIATGTGANDERMRVQKLRDRFAEAILSIPRTSLNGPSLAERHLGNCNIRFIGCSAKDLLLRMQPRLAASSGSACNSGMSEPSHVLMAIGLGIEEAEASIRFSFGRYSDGEQIEEAVKIITEAVTDARAAA